jgi:hypothetical protein
MTGHLACVVGKRAVAPGAHSISWADEAEFAGHPVAVDVPVPGDIFFGRWHLTVWAGD